jgi:hypothetical protein
MILWASGVFTESDVFVRVPSAPAIRVYIFTLPDPTANSAAFQKGLRPYKKLKFRTASQAKISHGAAFNLVLWCDCLIPEKIESATYRYYAA